MTRNSFTHQGKWWILEGAPVCIFQDLSDDAEPKKILITVHNSHKNETEAILMTEDEELGGDSVLSPGDTQTFLIHANKLMLKTPTEDGECHGTYQITLLQD